MDMTDKDLRIHSLRGDIWALLRIGRGKLGAAQDLENRYVCPGGAISEDEFYDILLEENRKFLVWLAAKKPK